MIQWLQRNLGFKRRSVAEIIAAAACDAQGGQRIATRAIQGPQDRAALERHFINSVGEIPGYALTRMLHRGGQGIVFEGRQTSTDRRVAIKVMQIPPQGAESELRAEQRFQREIRALAELNDPGIVTIHDSGVAGPQRYFVMEFVDGESLADRYADRVAEPGEAVRIVHAVAKSLQAAHAKGIVHRDLKPSNVMIDRDGRVRILDFGLAKLMPRSTDRSDGNFTTLSEEGQFYGTRAWASPEQVEGASRRITPRTDVYALGVILHHLLTSRFPYAVNGPASIISDNILNRAPEPLRSVRKGVPRDVECIVQKCLRKSASDRYSDAGDLADDLQRHVDGRAVSARGDGWLYRTGFALGRLVKSRALFPSVLIAVLAASAALGVLASRLIDPIDAWVLDRVVRARAWLHPDVRVIAITNETIDTLDQLGTEFGLTGVTRDDLYSWRSLHGALMRRLADARPKCVSWDIAFEAISPEHDPSFEDGIRRLQAAGTRVIIGARRIDRDGNPVINARLRSVVDDWGWVAAQFDSRAGVVTGAALIDFHASHAQHPSLSLATDRALRGAASAVSFSWHPLENVVSRRTETGPNAGRVEWIPFADRISQGANTPVQQEEREPRAFACLALAIPDSDDCAAATTAYHDVLRMPDAALAELFRNKAVVIGDCRHSESAPVDRHKIRGAAGAREEFGVYVQACAIGELSAGRSLGELGLAAEFGTALIAAAFGVISLHVVFLRRLRAYWIAAPAVSMLGLALCFLAAFLPFRCLPSLGTMLAAWILSMLLLTTYMIWGARSQRVV